MQADKLYLSKSIIYGVCVGDSVGMPVQFKSREEVKKNPVMDMIGYGTFDLPPGHWTDDSSLTFCLAESIAEGFDIKELAAKFVLWLFKGYWSSIDKAYDIGMTTYRAINNLKKGVNPIEAGGSKVRDNGNGSLMRILPLVLLTKNLKTEDRFQLTKDVSSLTHRHIRSILACFYYLEYAKLLIEGEDKFEAYSKLQLTISNFFIEKSFEKLEINFYKNLLENDISNFHEDEISSKTYVVDTLEASVWCFLTTENYKDCVLKATNLGHDTDTVAAIAGGLAALNYGYNNIPTNWLEKIIKKEKIDELAYGLSVSGYL